jgi:hypothetical protein
MSDEKNMDLFNMLTLQLFIRLHDSFPVRQNISLREYPELDNSENSKVFFDTIKFLKDEDFIQYSEQVYGGFISISLSNKGLSVLGTIPTSISKTESLIQLFKEAFKKGSSESYSMAVKELTKLAITAAVNKVSNE